VPSIAWTLQIAYAPAPPPVVDVVQEIVVDAAIDEASAVRVRLGLPQDVIGDWGVLALDLFRPLVPITVRVQVGTGLPEAIFAGYVTGQDATYSEQPGGTNLRVTAMDASLRMNLEEKVQQWPSMPDSAIAATVFGQYGVIPQVQPTGPVLVEPEGTTIQRGTDIRFLRRLARRNGFECYVQPEPISGLETGHFEPRSLVGVPESVISVNMGDATNVADFAIQYDMVRPTGAVGATLDIQTKVPQPAVAPVSIQVPLGLEPALTRIIPPPIVRPSGMGLTQTADLQTASQAIADRSSWSVVASGKVGPDVGVLRPGGLVNVRGAGRLFNGSYFVTRVQHVIDAGGYVQSFEAERNAVTMTGAELYVLP
jgi:phage protein D